MRVALIHYWLVTMRGGEKVLESLCRLFPQADIFTHVCVPENLSATLRSRRIKTSFIQKLPFSVRAYQKYLPLMPLALEQLDLRGYDLVISSESGPAKGVLTHSQTPHICYCHTPMRYLWDFYQDYLQEASPLIRPLVRLLTHRLRLWDVLSANRVDHFIANSHNVARRIARHYRREAEVIHPPVEVDLFTPKGDLRPPDPAAPLVYLGQLTGYKRADLAILACSRMNKPLLVIGRGPEEARLRSLAGPCVAFLGSLERADVVGHLQNCSALIFPGEEDFGLVPVEAMAAGRPVVAYARGGATETVREGLSGLFFQEQSVESLQQALERLETMSFDPAAIIRQARTFSEAAFAEAFMNLVRRATG
ncbi:MAG: glycosyltransferase [Deltaproteobacteria bacterium]|jgi:glycosyltransferase involved in cell wall biosynthesis|nr:glycosyltransferase [Deltaproteobacteria bacterium]